MQMLCPDCHVSSVAETAISPLIPASQISVMTIKVSQIPGVLSIGEEQLADPSLGMILRRKEADLFNRSLAFFRHSYLLSSSRSHVLPYL